MGFKISKSLAFYVSGTLVLGVAVYGFSAGKPSFSVKKAPSPVALVDGLPAASQLTGSLLSQDGQAAALRERDARRVRSPAFVPGSGHEVKLKASVERLLAGEAQAVIDSRLREYFPDHSPMAFWVRASVVLASVPLEGEITPENFEIVGQIYSQILNGEESAVSELQAALRVLPSSEAATRKQVFRMLSDIGMKNPGLRNAVKNAVLSETVRAGNTSDVAVGYAALMRFSPSKEGYRELNKNFEKTHPGVELSEFVVLNAAHL